MVLSILAEDHSCDARSGWTRGQEYAMAILDINLTVSPVTAEQALALATEAEEAFSGNGDIARIVRSFLR